jgi:hypothetical protein
MDAFRAGINPHVSASTALRKFHVVLVDLFSSLLDIVARIREAHNQHKMAGLETLATVCSIFQVISFSLDTIRLCKKVYRSGSSIDPELAENAAFLGHLSSQIHELDTTKASVRSRDDQQLYDVLKKCQAASRDLQEEVSFITGHAKNGSLASTLKIAAKTKWRKRRLDALERKMDDIQKLLEAGLLVRIW